MNKVVQLVLVGISILFFVWLGSVIYYILVPDLNNLIPIEQVAGEGVCKSSVLVKNIFTEDQVVLKDIIYQKDHYLSTMVSQDTICSKIFYGNLMGGYKPPTAVPTISPE